MSSAIPYRKEIDGLRAVAVISVVLFHAGFTAIGGGFLGVDVFFVISGYLISTIIFAEQGAGKFSLGAFYLRRARRIVPVLLAVLIATSCGAWAFLRPAEMASYSASLVSVASFVSNVFFWKDSGYFSPAAETKPLLHTWSLAVEEQYYLVFPVLTLLLARLGRAWANAVLTSILVASLALAHKLSSSHSEAAFFLLPFRFWELLVGVLVGRLEAHPRLAGISPGLRNGLCALGLGMILYAMFCFSSETPSPSLYTLVPTLGAGLVILFGREAQGVVGLLRSPLAVGVGLISYSTYLWHQPLFAFARLSGLEFGTATRLSLAGATLLLAFASWRFIERPLRSPAVVPNRTFVPGIVLLSLGMAGFGIFGRQTSGFETYYYAHRIGAEERRIYGLLRDYVGGNLYQEMEDDGGCKFWMTDVNDAFLARYQACTRKFGQAIVVLGDSHAMNLFNAVYAAGVGEFVVGLSKGGCRPHNNYRHCHYDGFDRFLNQERPSIALVLYTQSGSYLLRDEDARADGPGLYAGQGAWRIADDNLDGTRRYLARVAQQVPVRWIGPLYEPHLELRFVQGREADFYRLPARTAELYSALDDALFRQSPRQERNLRYLSLRPFFTAQGELLIQEECLVYRDSDHLSKCGERLLGAALRQRWEEIRGGA